MLGIHAQFGLAIQTDMNMAPQRVLILFVSSMVLFTGQMTEVSDRKIYCKYCLCASCHCLFF